MGEALITSRTGTISGSNGSGNNGAGLLKTEIFKTSDVFIVPKAKNQSFSVRIFGGGGGGAYCRYYYNSSKSYAIMAGGGGGWMNNNVLILDEGQHVPISIGSGGNSSITIDGKAVFTAGSGGTTSFGTYISALGGEGGEIENYGSCKGGNGGSGGGAYGDGGSLGSDGSFGGGGGAYGENAGNGGDGICIIQYYPE